ncbi:MAG: hypothetical protein JSU66_02040 [Deltaproteobacteria bacterium]|nr:MAG: hypothetical protein JSU66_02040 [Deltaproteobacteria bacterium]
MAEGFRRRFGRPAEVGARAPGRVNLIGEHTDYNDGLVLPCAIDRATVVLAARRDDARIRVYSRERDALADFAAGAPQRRGDWLDYVQAVVFALAERGVTVPGFDLAVASDVPLESGLSSSAALGVALATALDRALQTRAQAVRAAPRRARHWVSLARTRALAGDRLGALDAVARAVQLDPHSPVARVLEVRLLLALGRPEEAVTPLRDAIHSHPAAASQMLEALFRASDDASLVRAAVPDLAGPRRQVGRMLVAAGHARAGAEELAASLALGSAEPRTALESARAFAGAGDANAAISVLRETLARLPEDPLLASELARLEAARDAQSSVPRGGTS